VRGGAVAAGVGLVGLPGGEAIGGSLAGEEKGGGRTLSRHEERFPASCRARSRRRSYSASEEEVDWWLNAEWVVRRVFEERERKAYRRSLIG